jgi:hypothetical protein
MKNILIDLEFTGLDNTYVQDNEIVQLKLMDADTGAGLCRDFKANKSVSLYHQVYCGLVGQYPGEKLFSAAAFAEALEKIGVEPGDELRYYGYSVSTDRAMLKKNGLAIEIVDLQEKIRLNPKYERDLAVGCASMEAAYLLLTGKKPPLDTHLRLAELDLVREIFHQVVKFTDCNELLTLMPHGHCAGMPISQYVSEYRRAADGYRFHNCDLLAESLTAEISQDVSYDDDEWDSDFEDDEDIADGLASADDIIASADDEKCDEG